MPKVKVKVTPDEPVEINAQKVGMLFEMIGDVAKQTGNKASCKMVAPDFTVTIIVKPTEKK